MVEVPPVYITDILPEVVAKADTALRTDPQSWMSINNRSITYIEGTQSQIIQQLQTIKDGKYPMVMLILAEGTKQGNVSGFEEPLISGIYIATLSDNKRLATAKYTDNFKPVLYPIYFQILEQLAQHPNVVECHPDRIQHKAWRYVADNTNSANPLFTDFVDILGIENLTITTQQLSDNSYLLSI
jgi:hypothetical protein